MDDATSPGRWAWRIWGPPPAVTMIMIASVAYSGDAWLVPTGAQLILILHGAAALAFRMRYPVAVAVVTVAMGTALPLTAHHLILTDVASIVALYTLATLRDRRTAWTAAVLAAVALTGASAPWRPGGLADIRNLVPANYVALAVAAGDATRNRRALLAEVRARADQAERTREQEARRRVREERIRIARDLHDVVAHHITLVNAQAGVAHHLMGAHPDRAREALAGIRDTSRAALDELRATVGLLRADDEPESRLPLPAFAAVDDLIGEFRRSGFQVEIHREGTVRPVADAADLAAYRIVQEALTNAGKHGVTRSAEVRLTYRDSRLEISVVNPARPGHHGPGTGHGLIGMRERAEAAGGSCTAGPRDDGTYAVTASLPLRP
ncbi:sensor histidine kinase [Actinoplanes philippinensis]|uniref:sensor histidine kinase n=1 Tax=Actinoplanes philippinensis TaxID=35752 RepID=UPI0033F26D3B